MKNLLPLLLIAILFSNCSDDSDVDCETYDPGFATLHLKLVDANRDNLITKGTIDPNEVVLLKGESIQYNPPSEFALPDASLRVYDNTFTLSIPRETTFEYVIQVNESETITLRYSAEKKTILCGLSYFVPTEATLNNSALELQEVFEGSFLTEIVL